MMYCKNCNYWGEDKNDYVFGMAGGEGHKPCTHPKVGGGSYADDSRMADDALNSFELVSTGENFGCIHFNEK